MYVLPWTHCHIARVRPRLWSCPIRSSFKYNQASLIPLEPAFTGPVSRDAGVKQPVTSLRHLSCVTRKRLVVLLRNRLYLVGERLCRYTWPSYTLYHVCSLDVSQKCLPRGGDPYVEWSCRWLPRSFERCRTSFHPQGYFLDGSINSRKQGEFNLPFNRLSRPWETDRFSGEGICVNVGEISASNKMAWSSDSAGNVTGLNIARIRRENKA